MTEEEDSVYPIAVLIDELRIEDVGPRINSLRRLPVIARALGTERTISELIPYLTDSIDDAEDEVLLVMAEEIGKLVPFVGGPQFAPSLLPPLENLCNVEESAVRDKAVASLNNIAKDLPPEQLHNDYVKMVRRLATSDWATARAASCHLYSTLLPRLPEQMKSEIREIYKKLCHDEEPMVRRSACVNLKNIASVTDKLLVQEFLVPIFTDQSKDEQDSVRLLSVENSYAMAKSFGNIEQVLQHVLPVVRGYGGDKSWRVRYMFADHFTSICSAVGDDVTSSEMVNAFLRLTSDSEAEVRTSVACKVYDFCSIIRVEKVVKEILPAVQKLATDQSQHVRAALAGVVMKLAPLLGREHTTTQLLPLFLTLLKDDYPDVRLNLISKLDAVNEVIGVETLSRNLLPAVVKLAEDKQWRVRLAIINEIPILAAQFGVSFFDEQLMELCMNWLSDKVYEIRLATTEILKRLTELFGVEWARSKLIPKVLQLTANRNYLYRMTVLFAIKQMATVVNRDIVQQQLLPAVLKLANDPVPNIRFNCCKTLEVLLPNVTDSTPVKATLTKLHDDPDVDVRFFAGQALTLC